MLCGAQCMAGAPEGPQDWPLEAQPWEGAVLLVFSSLTSWKRPFLTRWL